MIHKRDICCPNCSCNDIVKNGHQSNGDQRWCCNKCAKSFQLEYRYNANQPGIGQKIDNQILNSSGVRDTARILKINPNTVVNHLKKKEPAAVNPYLIDKVESGQLLELEVDIFYTTEWDEFWSFVKKKSNPRWTWYMIERQTGFVVAWANGRRQDAVLSKLLDKVEHLPIRICHTDNWGAYTRLFPDEYRHFIGKSDTWKIERKNLNFRTHLKRLSRKTICFSKDEKIHDNVIGMYIEKYYYKTSEFAKAG